MYTTALSRHCKHFGPCSLANPFAPHVASDAGKVSPRSDCGRDGLAGTPHSGAAMAGARKRPRTAAAEGGRGIGPGTPREAGAGKRAGPLRQKRRGSENTRAPPGRAGGVAGQAESVAQLRIHSRPDSTACASSRWLPWASGCAACAVDQPWLRHIHSRVSATINFFAEPDVGARPGTEQFCGCAHPCCDQ